jgi:hypothetical protein
MTKKNYRPTIVTPREKKESSSLDVKGHEIGPISIDESVEIEQERAKRLMTSSAIVANSTVRTICQIMQNGTKMSGHPSINFEAHNGLLIQLHNAYNLKDREAAEKQFLEVLGTYLEQAAGRIPGAGRKEDVPIMIGLVTLLMHEHETDDGFDQVALHILRSAHAPVDRF